MLGGGNQKGEWYFYNPQLIKQGQQEWRRRWGNRPLEDNWRRQNKQVMIGDELGSAPSEGMDSTMLGADSIPARQTFETDIHKPEYYLQQIPRTPQQMEVSDSLLRQAMVDLYYIYRDKLEDEELTQETLRLLDERFPLHPSVVAIHEDEQLRALRHDENYIAKMRKMLAEQDSLYSATYTAYTKGDFRLPESSFRSAYRRTRTLRKRTTRDGGELWQYRIGSHGEGYAGDDGTRYGESEGWCQRQSRRSTRRDRRRATRYYGSRTAVERRS